MVGTRAALGGARQCCAPASLAGDLRKRHFPKIKTPAGLEGNSITRSPFPCHPIGFSFQTRISTAPFPLGAWAPGGSVWAPVGRAPPGRPRRCRWFRPDHRRKAGRSHFAGGRVFALSVCEVQRDRVCLHLFSERFWEMINPEAGGKGSEFCLAVWNPRRGRGHTGSMASA